MFKPMTDRVIVERIEEETTPSGLFIPPSARKGPKKAAKGVIRAVGDGRFVRGTGGEERKPMELSPGDMVLFPEYTGQDIEFEGKKCVLLSEQDIFATLD